jgi:hypothetical protein
MEVDLLCENGPRMSLSAIVNDYAARYRAEDRLSITLNAQHLKEL